MNKNFIFFSKLSLVLVLFVILSGSLVRMTGSGMGCPDWPKCFGYLIPPTNIEKITWQPNQTYNKGVMILHDKKFFNSKKNLYQKVVLNLVIGFLIQNMIILNLTPSTHGLNL